MAKVIQLKQKPDQKTIKLFNLSSDIDVAVVNAITSGLSPEEVAGVLANRLKEACLAIVASGGLDVLPIIKEKIL